MERGQWTREDKETGLARDTETDALGTTETELDTGHHRTCWCMGHCENDERDDS